MTQPIRKSIKELLAMSSTEVREYLQTLPASIQKTVGEELYRAILNIDMQKLPYHINVNSRSKSQ